MRAADLLSRLRGKIPCVTVLHGNEPWFIDGVVKGIRREFLGEEAEGFFSFNAPRGPGDREAVSLVHAVDEARTVPMFGGRKLVLLRAAGLEREEAEALASLARSSPEFSRFILVLPTLAKGLGKALAAAGATIAESKRLFDTPFPGSKEWDTPLNKWTTARSRERGKRMSLATAHVLTTLVGNELGTLDSALEKIAVAVGERGEVTEEDIHSLIGGGRGYGAFAFGDAIYKKDVREGFRISRNAFLEGLEDKRGRRQRDAGFVAGRLLWSVHYRLKPVYRARSLLQEGRTEDEVLRAIGDPKKPMVRRTLESARRFSLGELRRHHVLLADAEAELRTTVPKQVVIEALIPRLTGAADG